jgi:tRNA-dihydrouridine synthase 3
VQVCGNRPEPLIRLAEVIENELEVDFVDINLGCPMEMVYKQVSL